MSLSENSVPLNPVNDHYPYEKWLFHWEYTQHFQTNPVGKMDPTHLNGIMHLGPHLAEVARSPHAPHREEQVAGIYPLVN